MFAEVAVNVPVLHSTFHYHIPEGMEVQSGHLVQVGFRTGLQHGIVVGFSDTSPIPETKPILGILYPEPLLTLHQIDLAFWLSEEYRASLASCLWLLLPPGITGGRDTLITLLQTDAVGDDPVQQQIITLLLRRGALRMGQIGSSVMMKDTPAEAWRGATERLAKRGIIHKQPTLTAPRIKPKMIQTAALTIHPDQIGEIAHTLGKASRRADILEALAVMPPLPLKMAEVLLGTTRATLRKMADEGLLTLEQDTVTSRIPLDDLNALLIDLRDANRHIHILRMLARESDPIDVSWVYAQTGATLADLKRLEEEGYVLLGEKQKWRDPLAGRTFVQTAPPTLTQAQAAVWEAVRDQIHNANPLPASPVDGGGERQQSSSRKLASRDSREYREQVTADMEGGENPLPDSPVDGGGERHQHRDQKLANVTDEGGRRAGAERWQTAAELWAKLKPIAYELRQNETPAERRLWAALRGKALGVKFRRQHMIDRFIVDFYSYEARLIIEVDGEIHQYTQEEDVIRQAFLESLGLRVLRFSNQQVFQTLDRVIEAIQQTLSTPNKAAKKEQKQTRTSKARSSSTAQQTPPPSTREHDETSETSKISPTATQTPPPSTGEAGRGSTSTSNSTTSLPPFLLHGVTGSGKTEIYLRAIDAALQQGRGALFLVPEIALTPQTVRRVAARFPGQVAVMHSGLNDGERYDTWRRVKEGLARVVVGARSALFAPMENIGVIILDEAHDTSYKQSPHEDAPPFVSAPHYDARITAEEIAEAHNAVLIFGSATPSAEMIYRAELGEIERLHLPDRILGHREGISEQAQRARVGTKYQSGEYEDMHIDLPPVTVVDMREELRAGNTGMFSRQLHSALDQTLRRGEQAILFLNRRGQSTYVFCRDCGYVAACPNCDMPLTYHRAGEALRCHHCGHSTPSPLVCPQCGSQRIKFFGAGTQQVEQALISAFPQARPVRWDADTASNALMHEIILQRFIDHQADVIIGTQMVAKGLDLPMVTLVGVVSADMGLALPEFRAAERTFQLLTQVAGRAGRGLLGGRVILPTSPPGNPAIVAAAKHDIDGFYKQEIANRRTFGYPPFRRLVRVVFRDEREATARTAAEDAARILRHELAKLEMNDTELIGPAPCFMTKLNKHYRWHLLLRGPDPARVLDSLALDPSWYVDIDPVELL